MPAFSTTGSTQTLVPLAAIGEMEVRTTNAPAENQRTPGTQTSIVTRAGGDRVNASAFTDYRPNALAASDWFSNASQHHAEAARQFLERGRDDRRTGAARAARVASTISRAANVSASSRPLTTTYEVPATSLRDG